MVLIPMLFTIIANLPANRALELDDTYVTGPVIALDDQSDWTVECDFVIEESFGALIDNQASSAGDGFMIEVSPSGRLALTVNGTVAGNSFDELTEVFLDYGRHYHVAVTYEYDVGTGLGDMYWYLNGVRYEALLQVDYAKSTFTPLHIGRLDTAAVKFFHGRIDNLHMAEELLYAADFEPSPMPPTPTASSVLLASFDMAEDGDPTYDDESGQGNTLTAQGSSIVPIDTIGLKGGYARLNGFTSKLTLDDLDLGAGTSVTFECDLRFISNVGFVPDMTLIDLLESGAAAMGGFGVRLDPSTQFLEVACKADGLPVSVTAVPYLITENQWHRVAVVLEYSAASLADLRVYVDGQLRFQGSVGYDQPPSRALTIGAARSDAGIFDDFFGGHLDQMRLSTSARISGLSYGHYPGIIEDDADTVGLWFFDENDVSPAAFTDSTSNGLDLLATEVEAAHTWTLPFWPTPDISPSPYVYVTPQLPWPDEWTIEFWARRPTNLEEVILDAYDSTNMTGMELFVDATHQLIMNSSGTDRVLGTLNLNEWNHVVIRQRIIAPGSPPTVPPTVRQIATINGVLQTVTGTFSGPVITATHLLLGNNDDSTKPMAGGIHSLRISSSLRYSGDSPPSRSSIGSDSGTLGVWSIDEGLGETLVDRGPGGHDFVLCDGTITFTSQPVDKTSCLGETVLISVSTLDPVTTFQWRKDGVELAGQTQGTLVLEDVTLADEGDYDCIVSIGCDTVASDLATLTINDTYEFTSWPMDQTICAGDSVDLVVTVEVAKLGGSFDLQWQKDGVDLAGETNETLSIANAESADSGSYRCRMQPQPFCSFQYSPLAVLDITGPSATAGPDQVLCLPGESITLQGNIDCLVTGTVTWLGPGSILNGDTLSPTVTPTALAGDYVYTLQFDYVGGSSSDDLTVQVRDYGFAFGNGMVDLGDILVMAAQWSDLVDVSFDVYPSGGDGSLDIRDMISLTQCHSFSP